MPEPLSTNALRLLTALRDAAADHRDRAVTDKRLTELTSLPHRVLIDAADDLLAAGYPAVAGGHGRWLGDVTDLTRYIDSLDGRARKVFIRRQHALAVREKLRRGQLNLFAGGAA